MILQALCEYYDRKAALGEMPLYGREWKPIPYLVVIREDGSFVRLQSTLEGEGKERRAKRFMLCHTRERTGSHSWATANSLWDHYGYVFGFPKKMDFGNAKSVDTGQKQCRSFQEELSRLARLNPNDSGLKTVMAFYSKLDENIKKLREDPLYDEAFKKEGTNFAFRLLTESDPVGTAPDFNYGDTDADAPKRLCLVMGECLPIAVTNGSISLRNANPKGGKLVGFQRDSGYDSYHKEQGFNAPVSEKASYAYTTALNTLLGPRSRNKFPFGKDTLVFWAGKDNAFEDIFSVFFSALPQDDPDKNVEKIASVMKAPYTGTLTDDDDTMFYLLLLSPNNARIAVKLWEEASVRTFAANIRRFFSDLEIVKGPWDKEYLPLANLLRSISLLNNVENLPPQLFQAMMRAILEGLPFPELLETQTIERMRADKGHPKDKNDNKHDVMRERAALLKAYLNRKRNNNQKPITMSLDLTNDNQAYLCGRLFAIFEKIQQDALGDVNATIRDRYYDSFSCTPNVAFARLTALSNHHLQKLDRGKQVYYEKLKGEVIGQICSTGLPAHFSLDDQSRFAIGYYHQRQAFYKRKDAQAEDTDRKA